MVWISNGESGSDVRAKLNAISNNGGHESLTTGAVSINCSLGVTVTRVTTSGLGEDNLLNVPNFPGSDPENNERYGTVHIVVVQNRVHNSDRTKISLDGSSSFNVKLPWLNSGQTVTSVADGIILGAAGDFIALMYDGSEWQPISLGMNDDTPRTALAQLMPRPIDESVSFLYRTGNVSSPASWISLVVPSFVFTGATKTVAVISALPITAGRMGASSYDAVNGPCIRGFDYQDDSGVTAITNFGSTLVGSVDGDFNIQGCDNLASINLFYLSIVTGNVSFTDLAALTSLSFGPSFIGGKLSLVDLPTLTSYSIAVAEISGAGGTAVEITGDCGDLTTVYFSGTKCVNGDVLITGAAVSSFMVDQLLIALAAMNGTSGTVAYSNRTVTITGASEAPGVDGLAAKVTLEGRGCTVTTN